MPPILKRLTEFFVAPSGSSTLLLWIVRAAFVANMLGVAYIAFAYYNEPPKADHISGLIASGATLLCTVIVLVADLSVRNKQVTTFSAVYLGLLMGFVLGALVAGAVEPVVDRRILPFLRLPLTVFCCYVTVSILLQTKDEFRFIIPYVEFQKQLKGGKPLVLDTSVIIDGRIADTCDTGIIDTKLLVPRFVLQELQSVADSSDKIKRNRGRRGLDILKRMQSNTKIDMQMHEANVAELRDVQKVDERLVVLAKVLGARVVTNDFNLNKIAQLQGVEVINLNELANALKLVALPGEHLHIRIVKQGDQVGQGVGYLDDGTMVVVEQGRSVIGQEVAITVTSVLQTPAGRMIFGKIEPRSNGPGKERDMTLPRLLMPFSVVIVLICTSMPSAQTKTGGASKDNSDIEFVEKLLIARRDYQRTLELLRAHYINTGDVERAKWAEEELREYHRINHQAYRLDLDVPPPTLQASTNIPDANKLLTRSKEYKDKGYGENYIDNQRRAELLLQQLLTQYPTSTKIGEAAYMLGDLYESNAYKQYRRSALYFERAFQWNPSGTLDARIRAARIYDKRLPERARAIEIYKEITQHETDPKHIQEANARLKALSAAK